MGRITDNRADVYQEITDQMIAMIEAGTRPWSKSWNGSNAPTIPLRSTGVPYRGINVLTLWVASMTKGFASPHWLTFKQALALGGCVRKGEKGSTVVYANKIVVGDGSHGGANGEAGEGGQRQVAFLKRYTVFNAEQIDGIEAQYPTPAPIITATNPDDRDAELDALFSRVPVTVRHHGAQPYYRPSADHVVMPHFADFHTSDDYYSTLALDVGNIASVLVAGGAGEGAVERYLRHLHCGEQSPGGGRLDARTAAGAATQRCGVIGIAAGASGIRRRLPASRSSAVLAR